MKIDSETKRKLRDMKAVDLLEALEDESPLSYDITAEERLRVAVDVAYSRYINRRINGLISTAKLRYPEADVHLIEFIDGRGLSKAQIAEYATCEYINEGNNIIIEGFAGTGKTYLACALTKEACKRQISTRYVRLPDLKEEWEKAKLKPNGVRNLKRRYGRYSLLVVDEWMLEPITDEFRNLVLEIFELRYKRCSTILCTQAKVEDWHAKLGGDTTAESIIDRIVHNTSKIKLQGINMRKRLG